MHRHRRRVLLGASRAGAQVEIKVDIPVVSVVWAYSGISPQEMADRNVTIDERAMTTTVNNDASSVPILQLALASDSLSDSWGVRPR